MGKDKSTTYFDAAGFELHCEQIAKHGKAFADAVEALRKEGLPVSVKELRTWPERFGDFGEDDGARYKKHFVNLYRQAESRGGWLPMSERQRMFDSYISVFNRTVNAASRINSALMAGGCVIEDTPDGAAVNVEATEAEHRKQFIIPVHGDKMEEHWNLLLAAKQAISDLKAWEARNGMPQTGENGDYNSFGDFINGVRRGIDGTVINISREAHDKAVWQYFKLTT